MRCRPCRRNRVASAALTNPACAARGLKRRFRLASCVHVAAKPRFPRWRQRHRHGIAMRVSKAFSPNAACAVAVCIDRGLQPAPAAQGCAFRAASRVFKPGRHRRTQDAGIRRDRNRHQQRGRRIRRSSRCLRSCAGCSWRHPCPLIATPAGNAVENAMPPPAQASAADASLPGRLRCARRSCSTARTSPGEIDGSAGSNQSAR